MLQKSECFIGHASASVTALHLFGTDCSNVRSIYRDGKEVTVLQIIHAYLLDSNVKFHVRLYPTNSS